MKHLVALGLAASLLVACGGGSQITGHNDGGTRDGGVTDGGSDGGADGGTMYALSSINPTSGPLSGGTAVEIRGTGLANGITISIGGAACTGLVVVSTTRASCTTPAHATAETVDVVAAWPDGTHATLPGAFTYETTAPATVGFAQIFEPATDPNVAPGDTVTVSAQVYVAGVTPGAGQGAGVSAQVGFGPATADPSANPTAFAFTDLAYTGDADGISPGDKANDVYGGSIAVPSTTGTYRLAVRFSADGATWTYADRTGTSDGFSPSDLPTVTVQAQASPTVGYAQILTPATDPSVSGGTMVAVSAQVYVAGVTGGPGQGGGVTAQAGFGPAADDPSATPAAFTFSALSYTGDHDGLSPGDKANDVYGASLAAPTTAAAYRLAVRFSTDGGTTWTYADRTGTSSSAPFDATDIPTVTVTPAGTVSIDYCELHFPSTLLGAPGQATSLVFGWVYTQGVTDQAGQGAGITGQVGVGATGTDPSSDPSWTFTDATYNADTNNGANDEYMATITAPATAGSYDYAYRFSGDGGQTWTYCDLPGTGGAAGGSTNGYASADAGKLTVMTQTIDYCELTSPATLSATAGQTGLTVYGSVYKQGVTDTGSQGPYLEGQLGLGPHGTDPSQASTTGWNWIASVYQGKEPGQANNDEYKADLTAPSPSTQTRYDYAYRFRVTGSTTWTYCDLPGTGGAAGGSTNGYSPANAGVLTVQ